MSGRDGSGSGAIVTGAGSGIGRACAIALAESGLSLVLAGRRVGALEETRSLVEETAGDVTVAVRATDVAVAGECEALVADAVTTLGRVGVVVTAAAGFEPAHVLDIDADAWDRCFDSVLRGSALVAIAAARHMREQGGGRIVLVSSINGHESEPETAHYSAAKAGVISLARSMAVDLAPTGILVNSVAPGMVDTPMSAEFLAAASAEEIERINPSKRLGRPEEIADVVAYLATRSPAFLTGSTLYVDGGQTAAAVVP